jgi:hypothetical protein
MNEHFNHSNQAICLTADIGMSIRVTLPHSPSEVSKIEVRCSKCNLNNDYTDDDKYHSLDNIKEVCLKWEEEGLMYFCHRHDPESSSKTLEKLEFAERLERYQPLRHMEIRVK